MFRHDALIKPKSISLLLTLISAVAIYNINQFSPFIGYLLAILCMLLLGFLPATQWPIWPTVKTPENSWIFALYWGLILGLIMPFLLQMIAHDGLQGIIQLLMD